MGIITTKLRQIRSALRQDKSRSTPADSAVIDGGRHTTADIAAPKTIRCRKITAFSCAFSTMAYLDAPEVPPAGVYHLTAARTGNIVNGQYRFRRHDGSGKDRIFTTDTAFLDELAKIVKEGGLAQFNGIHTTVSGLPDLYGAELSVRYASGESISAGDNQDCFLPAEVMTALVETFTRQIGDPTCIEQKGVSKWD